MKALTLWEPWATAIALGRKAIETRSWCAPRYLIGQDIAIHAARRKPDPEDVRWLCPDLVDTEWPLGCVVAIARLERCLPVERVVPCEEEMRWGNYEPGRFAWYFENVRSVEPIPTVGRQGLWEWNGGFA